MDKYSLPSNVLDTFDYVLTDCDGVLWIDNSPIPGSSDVLNLLREKGKKIKFITNNDKTRAKILEKCQKLGFQANQNEIYTASYFVAKYLSLQNFTKKVYIIGNTGIADELTLMGIESLPVGPDPIPSDGLLDFSKVQLDSEVGAVIVGSDYHFSYLKIFKGANYLKNPYCQFIGTNEDFNSPSETKDIIYPGAGALLKAIETPSMRRAEVLGKPNKFVYECVANDEPDIKPERCIIFGDLIYSDILLGSNIGVKTVLVLSGVSTMQDVNLCFDNKHSELLPTYILPSLAEFLKILQ